MSKLYDQFTSLRDEKKSIIILGLDPKTDLQREKVVELSEIKEGIIGFKPNLAFYQDDDGKNRLKQISRNAGNGLIRILDLKSPDGAATNEATLKEYFPFFEYVTIAPGAGCIEETIEKAHILGQETISMGVMSFPGVLREITTGLPLFKQRVDRAIKAGTSGFVLGATAYVPKHAFDEVISKYRNLESDKGITESEFTNRELRTALANRNELFTHILDKTANKDILYLVPGFGRQGGNIKHFLASGIDLKRCMINAGSDILKTEDPSIALSEMNNTFNKYMINV